MTPKKSGKKSQHSVYLRSTIPSVTSENFEKVVLWDTLGDNVYPTSPDPAVMFQRVKSIVFSYMTTMI